MNVALPPPKSLPTPQPRADVDPVLETQVQALREQAAAEKEARLKGGQGKWMMPEKREWEGDVFDFQGMASMFDRSASNEAFEQATKDPNSPGTTGDLVVTTLQVDWLACMERAFRDRHTMRRTRALAHAMGRKAGHGHNKGPLTQAVLEFVRGLVKKSKD